MILEHVSIDFETHPLETIEQDEILDLFLPAQLHILNKEFTLFSIPKVRPAIEILGFLCDDFFASVHHLIITSQEKKSKKIFTKS
jgi:hypothetical protein